MKLRKDSKGDLSDHETSSEGIKKEVISALLQEEPSSSTNSQEQGQHSPDIQGNERKPTTSAPKNSPPPSSSDRDNFNPYVNFQSDYSVHLQQHAESKQQQQPQDQPQPPTSQDSSNFFFKVGRPRTSTTTTASKTADQFKVKKFNSKTPKPKPTNPRPHACTFEGCNWSFARQSDLRRHARSHVAPAFQCPYFRNDPTCHRNGGAFNRLDVLKRHLRLVHYVKDKHQIMPGGGSVSRVNGETSKDDPGWCRACQRMFPNLRIFVDHCVDCAQSLTPAEWKKSGNGEKGGEEDVGRYSNEEKATAALIIAQAAAASGDVEEEHNASDQSN